MVPRDRGTPEQVWGVTEPLTQLLPARGLLRLTLQPTSGPPRAPVCVCSVRDGPEGPRLNSTCPLGLLRYSWSSRLQPEGGIAAGPPPADGTWTGSQRPED